MATLKTLETTAQYHLLSLVLLRCLIPLYVTGYINIYAKKNYHTQSSFDSRKVNVQTLLISISLVRSMIFWVFIDLFTTFHTIDHSIWVKKLKMFVFNTTNLVWFGSYLTGKKEYIKITGCADTVKQVINCGMP